MTIEEAIERLHEHTQYYIPVDDLEAFGMAFDALRAKQQREQLWHDAKTDPPPQPGTYYGDQDDTNSMWTVWYRDGIWTMGDQYGRQIDIVRWAFYDAFDSEDAESDAEENEPSGWISIKDRLPENGEEVLAFFIGTPYHHNYPHYSVALFDSTMYAPQWDYCTHWMPLPEPPKE